MSRQVASIPYWLDYIHVQSTFYPSQCLRAHASAKCRQDPLMGWRFSEEARFQEQSSSDLGAWQETLASAWRVFADWPH